MKISLKNASLMIVFAILAVALAQGRAGGEVDCLTCHEALAKEKVVHAALQMGCPTCHSGIDASEYPHKKTNTFTKGLSSEQPDLCYGCHDKSKFTKKTVHAAIGMGCTMCHNPHSSKNEKLLKSETPDLCYGCHDKSMFTKKDVHPALSMGCISCHNPHSTDTPKLLVSEPPGLCFNCHDKKMFEGKDVHSPVAAGMCTSCHSPHSSDGEKLLVSAPPDLCFTCHDKAEFSRKYVHMPVAGGLCLTCHKPHASDNMALLLKQPVYLCLQCHADVRKKPHALAGGMGAHPIGLSVRGKELDDPVRPGKKFYCGSCHNPHSSDSMKLFRFNARSSFELCQNCHKK